MWKYSSGVWGVIAPDWPKHTMVGRWYNAALDFPAQGELPAFYPHPQIVMGTELMQILAFPAKEAGDDRWLVSLQLTEGHEPILCPCFPDMLALVKELIPLVEERRRAGRDEWADQHWTHVTQNRFESECPLCLERVDRGGLFPIIK